MNLILKKITAIEVLFFFLSGTFHVPISYAAKNASVKIKKVFPADLNQMSLPAEMGRIEQTSKGTNGKTVILIQDAHSIPDAQRNIHKLIEYFQKEYGVKSVMVEGAASKLDPQIFRSFPDKKRLAEVFEAYQEKGELTGSTAAAIFSAEGRSASGGGETKYIGVEDWSLYE